MLDGAFGLVVLGLWIFCLLDVITTDESACRNLGKTTWLFVVLLFPGVGSVVWLAAGRPPAARSLPYKGNTGPISPLEMPRHLQADGQDDETFRREARQRAEEQRARYRAQQRRELGETEPPTP